MPFYEIIYETGNHSIACYEDDNEARLAVQAHHDRAKQGLKAQESNPDMGPAERIVKVFKYDKHPVEFNESQYVSADEVSETMNAFITKNTLSNNEVSVTEVAAAVRGITDPMVESGPHESNYKVPETGELTGWDN